jgi:hypothetical protein
VPCPSGPVTPDTFRLWESLEAGCVPIVDATCPKSGFPDGFWPYTLHSVPPFPIIYDWKDLPDMIEAELNKWPFNAVALGGWWREYQASSYGWLATDFEDLRREA